MKQKHIFVLSLMVAAFGILVLLPAEDVDALDAGTDNVGSVYVGDSETASYTFSGGRWNDSIKTGPTVQSSTNCTVSSLTATNIGSGSDNQWSISCSVSPTAAGSFTATIYLQTQGGFLAPADEYTLTINGTGVAAYTYTLQYNANGGSGAPATQTHTGTVAEYNFTISNTQPTRSGYNFLGWNTIQDAPGAVYDGGDFISVQQNQTVTLYAIWQQDSVPFTASVGLNNFNSGSATVSGGGQSQTTTSSTSISVSNGTSVTFSASIASGYNFSHWVYYVGSSMYTSYSLSFTVTASNNVYATMYATLDTFTLYFQSDNPSYGTVSRSSFAVEPGTLVKASGSTLILTNTGYGTQNIYANVEDPTPEYSYAFDGWYDANNNKLTSTSVEYNASATFTAKFTRSLIGHTVTFVANDPLYGHFEPSATLSVPNNATITINDAVITINNVMTTAVPSASDGTYSYSFTGWDVQNGDVITQDKTITATFSRSLIGATDVYWSNDMMNGSVTMVYSWPGSSNKDHNMAMDLYTPTVQQDQTTVWSQSGYTLNIGLSYPTTNLTFNLMYNGSSELADNVTLGNWSKYELKIDANKGIVTATPISSFTDFTNYQLMSSLSEVVFDFSSEIKNTAISVIDHQDVGNGQHVRFSVVDTEVFLNTYGVVMNNPTINVYNHFPQYSSVRLNFYSFALYGSSFTINGITYALDGAQTTVSYVESGKNHLTPSLAPGEPVLTKTMDVSNIYVTWDGSNNHVYLTFADNKFTIDLGTYTNGNETVSFSGLWYFTSVLYEPVTVTEKELGPWKALPDLDWNAMIILFLACLLIIGIIAYIKLEGGLLDAVILGAAALIGLMLLG